MEKWRQICRIYVYKVCGCFDSPARCAVQNMNQFNCYFGCSWSLHPGTLIEEVMKYNTLEENPELRTEQTVEIMSRVLDEDKGNINGVKGSSPLILAEVPRSITERKYWKANEWKTRLLFYALPCLRRILPGKYMQYLLALKRVSFYR
nr:uncharacterized protein LOC122270008 [Parasteatoda tepidariorum]